MYSLHTHYILLAYSLHSHCILIAYLSHTSCILIAYSLHTHYILFAYSLHSHCIIIAYSLHIPCKLIAHSLHTHCILIAYLLHAHYILIAYSLHSHCVLIIYSLHTPYILIAYLLHTHRIAESVDLCVSIFFQVSAARACVFWLRHSLQDVCHFGRRAESGVSHSYRHCSCTHRFGSFAMAHMSALVHGPTGMLWGQKFPFLTQRRTFRKRGSWCIECPEVRQDMLRKNYLWQEHLVSFLDLDLHFMCSMLERCVLAQTSWIRH